MTESEKWGLPGLLAQLPGRGENASSFVMGHDLNSLGIDFDSPDPIFPTFTTPFADATSRPAIPEFQLPAAYSVNNVPALHTRMSNFADETLFAIFYQYTRDVMQEIAAAELYTRDWRWHKELRQWMMKDAGVAAPMRISERTERGVYVFFDAMNWKRERVRLPLTDRCVTILLLMANCICRGSSYSTTTTWIRGMVRRSRRLRRDGSRLNDDGWYGRGGLRVNTLETYGSFAPQ